MHDTSARDPYDTRPRARCVRRYTRRGHDRGNGGDGLARAGDSDLRRDHHFRPRERRQQPRSDALRSVRGPEHPLRDVRLARAGRPEGQHHPVARREVDDVHRRQGGHVHPSHGREVPRRLGVRRRVGEVEHRALQDGEGLAPNGRPRARRHRRRGRRVDRQVQPEAGLLAAARCARRPRRHDG